MSTDQLQSAELSVKARAFSVSSLIGSSVRSRGDSAKPEILLPSDCRLNHFVSENALQTLNSIIPNQSITAELLCRELWLEFHALGTEMIITKAGRRMFPSLKVRLSGLEEDVPYIVYIDMDPVDDKRYRYIYQSSKWVPGGPGDIPHQERRFLHPDGPQLGKFWNRQSCVAFDKLKLTNSRKPFQREQIPLHSMHRYQPKLYIQPIPNDYRDNHMNNSSDWWKTLCRRSSSVASFSFPETQFITVTAYQNQQITRLKIASNPFAKGFRESSREPRKFEAQEDEDVPSNKRIRNSPIGKGNSFDSFQFAEMNSWNSLHQSVLPPIHNWWIQQYSIFNHPFLSTLSSISYDRQAGEVIQHHQYVLSESPLM